VFFDLAWYISVDLSYVSMQKYSATGISFPNEILRQIDAKRGDVSRSRYMLRLLEKVLQTDSTSGERANQSAESPDGFDSNG
jgi:hypothetical protein